MRYARTVRFKDPKPLTEYLENGRPIAGDELGWLILPPAALDAIAASKMSGRPCELVVTGEEWAIDGRHFLTFGASRDHIEAVTDYRDQDGFLHYICPECEKAGGKHHRGCSRKVA